MRVHLPILWALLLSACSSIPAATIASPERLTPIEAKVEMTKSILVTDVTVFLADKTIGRFERSPLCVVQGKLEWRNNPNLLQSLRNKIAETLASHGYNVAFSLIRAQAARDAEILIGVGLEDVKANICDSDSTELGSKGEVSLRLRWQVMDREGDGFSLFSGSGAARLTNFTKTGDPDVFLQAVAMATENILAQEEFYAAVVRAPRPGPPDIRARLRAPSDIGRAGLQIAGSR